ncbi:alpha/beta fold hydrolase [Paenibacillus turpanensis]|uniref:alpha/beta fold hydrolase n=1 Tax=Paenibacillus turpanensis TaxID=2689078 RepID=UPI0014099918|nr:alpha/beta hydrolase [Paenibacillus turpanensis]
MVRKPSRIHQIEISTASSVNRRRKRTFFTIAAVLILFIVALFAFPAWTPAIRSDKGEPIPESIAVLEQVELGGFKQSVLIRGKDRRNPVLLFLHGGPGYPQIPFARKHQELLEEHFVVVQWDQRGSGKSYHWGMSANDLQVERLIEDTHELTQLLLQRFQQPKLFLAGHSWGSLLGIWTAQRYPGDYLAYIGIGQVADSPRAESASYRFVLEEAKRRNDAKAIQELEAIGPPPYGNPRKDTTLERKWVAAFGGSERGSHSSRDLLEGILLSPEYTWLDGLRLAVGNSFSAKTIMPQIEHVSLFETVPKLELPVYVAMGRHDHMTPSEVAFDYMQQLDAPFKQFQWFEDSAHFPHMEEPERFAEWMRMIKAQCQ